MLGARFERWYSEGLIDTRLVGETAAKSIIRIEDIINQVKAKSFSEVWRFVNSVDKFDGHIED